MKTLTPTHARKMSTATEYTLAELRALCVARGWAFREGIDRDVFGHQYITAIYTTTTGLNVVCRGEAKTAGDADGADMKYSYHDNGRTAYTGAAAHLQRMQKAATHLRRKLAR